MMEKRSKYNAKSTRVDGITFDSKAEARRYGELKLMEQAGAITDLKVHPRYTVWEGYNSRADKRERIIYEADFSYVENGRLVAEDVKGVLTQTFKDKSKMFRCKFSDIELRIVEA